MQEVLQQSVADVQGDPSALHRLMAEAHAPEVASQTPEQQSRLDTHERPYVWQLADVLPPIAATAPAADDEAPATPPAGAPPAIDPDAPPIPLAPDRLDNVPEPPPVALAPPLFDVPPVALASASKDEPALDEPVELPA